MRLPASDKNTLTVSRHYPRTGKRGVPQQFPRKLYEMLETESGQADASNTPLSENNGSADSSQKSKDPIIEWSASGRAFRIVDVEKFSTLILPKFFRTSNFSSFQRNLNLYGFSKVRRGPDSDMYAHPSFMRGVPELLSTLRKCKNAADRKRLAKTMSERNFGYASSPISSPPCERVVSPSPPHMPQIAPRQVDQNDLRNQIPGSCPPPKRIIPCISSGERQWTKPEVSVQRSTTLPRIAPRDTFKLESHHSIATHPDNKLNLLAMALVSMAES